MRQLKEYYYRLHNELSRRQRLSVLRERLRNRMPLVLVHQMGRSASMTMVNTIRDMKIDIPVYHTHWLDPVGLQKRFLWAHRHARSIPFNIRVSKMIVDTLPAQLMGNYPWLVASVIREPVARNLSAYFLSIEHFIADVHERYDAGRLSWDEVLETFIRNFPHEEPLEWFDREVNQVFGINVYDFPFSYNRGYMVIERGPVRVAIIKVEMLSESYCMALGQLLGKEPGPLHNTHISIKDEPYAKMYDEFLRQVRLPESYLDSMYRSSFVRHFYSNGEIDAFKRKWMGI